MTGQYPGRPGNDDETRILPNQEWDQNRAYSEYEPGQHQPRQVNRPYAPNTESTYGQTYEQDPVPQHRGYDQYGSGSEQPPVPKKERPLHDSKFAVGVLATGLVGAIAGWVGSSVLDAVYSNNQIGSVLGGAPQDTVASATYGGVIALVGGLLLWLLVNTAPAATTFFAWIAGLVAFAGVALPFLNSPSFQSALGPAILNGALGVLVISLLMTVAKMSKNPKYVPES